MLVSLKKVLSKAQKGRYAVGAFNINNLEILEGIMAAAIKLKAPVILQTSEGAIEYAGMDYLIAIAKVAAKNPIPVVLHLDHGKDTDLIKKAIESGYTSVMFDGSRFPFDKNVKITKEIVEYAHRRKVDVEAEIGRIRGKEDFVTVKDKEAFLTDPEQAEKFVKKTKCDALAVAIGTAHGPYKFKKKPQLDFDRLKKIQKRVNIPLVLHGASGVARKLVRYANKYCKKLDSCDRFKGAIGVDDMLIKTAIKYGIVKINTDTDLRIAFTGTILNTLIENKKIIDPRKYLGPAMNFVSQVVEERIRLFGSAGKG